MKVTRISFRWWVAALLLAASILNYFDRQTVSVLKLTLERTLVFDDQHYALLINVFMSAYAIAYIASGWFVDRFGSRRMLTVFAALWSAATIGCGMATTFAQLALMRGLLGIAEPGVQPVTVRAAAVWAPPENRGAFMSFCSLGSSIGAIAAPGVIAFFSIHYNWRLSFVLPGLLGFILALIWFVTYREPKLNAQEVPVTLTEPALPWSRLWTKRSLWGILLGRVLCDPVWYFILFWMIGYLQEQKGASMAQVGKFAWIPFIAANTGSLCLVTLSDFLSRRSGSTVRSRKLVLTILSMLAPVVWLVPKAHGLALSIALFSVLAVVSNTWLYMLQPIIAEIFPLGNVASIWGIVGAFGAVGTVLFNLVLGRIPHTEHGYFIVFLMLGLFPPCIALIVNLLVRNKPVALTQ